MQLLTFSFTVFKEKLFFCLVFLLKVSMGKTLSEEGKKMFSIHNVYDLYTFTDLLVKSFRTTTYYIFPAWSSIFPSSFFSSSFLFHNFFPRTDYTIFQPCSIYTGIRFKKQKPSKDNIQFIFFFFFDLVFVFLLLFTHLFYLFLAKYLQKHTHKPLKLKYKIFEFTRRELMRIGRYKFSAFQNRYYSFQKLRVCTYICIKSKRKKLENFFFSFYDILNRCFRN